MQATVGTLSGDWSEEGSPLYVQSATVDLVAEAMLWAADADAALLSPAALGGASAASRFSGEDDTAALSLRDCAALAPGDSPVVLVELTGAELRQWLDRSAEGVPTCSMVWTTPSIWGLLRDSGWTASPLRAPWWTTGRPSA